MLAVTTVRGKDKVHVITILKALLRLDPIRKIDKIRGVVELFKLRIEEDHIRAGAGLDVRDEKIHRVDLAAELLSKDGYRGVRIRRGIGDIEILVGDLDEVFRRACIHFADGVIFHVIQPAEIRKGKCFSAGIRILVCLRELDQMRRGIHAEAVLILSEKHYFTVRCVQDQRACEVSEDIGVVEVEKLTLRAGRNIEREHLVRATAQCFTFGNEKQVAESVGILNRCFLKFERRDIQWAGIFSGDAVLGDLGGEGDGVAAGCAERRDGSDQRVSSEIDIKSARGTSVIYIDLISIFPIVCIVDQIHQAVPDSDHRIDGRKITVAQFGVIQRDRIFQRAVFKIEFVRHLVTGIRILDLRIVLAASGKNFPVGEEIVRF